MTISYKAGQTGSGSMLSSACSICCDIERLLSIYSHVFQHRGSPIGLIMGMPTWFNIIHQWTPKGMGETGVTLPFLIGAICYENGNETPSRKDVLELLGEMKENPVEGYMVVIQWCGDIDEPVIWTRPLNDPYKISIKSSYPRQTGDGESIVFTGDLMSMLNLDCTSAEECFDKLAGYATEHVENRRFSKNVNPETLVREFGPFNNRDWEYIKSVIPESA